MGAFVRQFLAFDEMDVHFTTFFSPVHQFFFRVRHLFFSVMTTVDEQQGGEHLVAGEEMDEEDPFSMMIVEASDDISASSRPNMRRSYSRLQQRFNEFEERFCCVIVIEDMLLSVQSHYTDYIANHPQSTRNILPLFVGIDASSKTTFALPDSIEPHIESLWMGRMTHFKLSIDAGDGEVKLDPTKLRDGRPLPILIMPDGGKAIIVRRSEESRHSYILKNYPELPGCLIDPEQCKLWLANGNIARRSDDTSVWPNHLLLDDVMTLWCGCTEPFGTATLVADMKRLRHFMSCMSEAKNPRIHFSCLGQTVLYASIVLIAGDAERTELARLPVGSAKIVHEPHKKQKVDPSPSISGNDDPNV